MEKGLGHFFVTSSSSHFFNKTDFEQYVFNVNETFGELLIEITVSGEAVKEAQVMDLQY